MSDDYNDYLHLLLRGDLPPAVFKDKRFIKIAPIVNAVEFIRGKGEEPPYQIDRVASIAEKKFNLTSQQQKLLDGFKQSKADKVVLEVVQQRLSMERLAEEATTQLASGTYNPLVIEQILDSSKSTNVPYIQPVYKPTNHTLVEIITRSGIRPIDKLIGGFGAELIIVSARVKTGKTRFLLNVAARQPPTVKMLYITVADYGARELNHILHVIDPKTHVVKAKSLFIADMTSFTATLVDVESAIKKYEPTLCIIDRAEKLAPIRMLDKKRQEVGEIFEVLRQFAKRYECTVITDAQYSSEGAERQRQKQGMTSEFMAEDRTNRQAVMDLWFGLERLPFESGKYGWKVYIEGRRDEVLPACVEVVTDHRGVVQ